ncbi:hypothetical protein BH20CHL3_BH20CHL3_06040 [soil metagenome]
MNNRSEIAGKLDSQTENETETEAAEIPKRAGIAAAMFFRCSSFWWSRLS